MSRLFIIIVLITLSVTFGTKAQQQTLYTQYIFNLLTLNPAYGGSQNYPIFTTMLRQHWSGIRGAPKSASVSGHLPFKQTKSSLGGLGYFDNIGPLTNSSLYAIYSYKVPVTKSIVAALGLQFGFNYTSVNLSTLTITPDITGQTDQAFQSDKTTGFNPNLGLGLYLSSNKAFISFSIPTLINYVLENDNSSTDNTQSNVGTFSLTSVTHFYTAFGAEFNLSPHLKLKPNAMLRLTTSSTPPSIDINTYLLYKNAFWFGLGYRLSESISAIVNLPVLHNMRVGYAYDYPLAISLSLTTGSHEVFVNYSLKQKSTSYINPRNF